MAQCTWSVSLTPATVDGCLMCDTQDCQQNREGNSYSQAEVGGWLRVGGQPGLQSEIVKNNQTLKERKGKKNQDFH